MSPTGNVHREWQCPHADTSEKYRLGWLNESVEEGNAWNESQRGFQDWRKSLDILSGAVDSKAMLMASSRA